MKLVIWIWSINPPWCSLGSSKKQTLRLGFEERRFILGSFPQKVLVEESDEWDREGRKEASRRRSVEGWGNKGKEPPTPTFWWRNANSLVCPQAKHTAGDREDLRQNMEGTCSRELGERWLRRDTEAQHLWWSSSFRSTAWDCRGLPQIKTCCIILPPSLLHSPKFTEYSPLPDIVDMMLIVWWPIPWVTLSNNDLHFIASTYDPILNPSDFCLCIS